MSKALLICSHYFDDSDANALCSRNIVDELVSRGFVVSVITDTPMNTSSYNMGVVDFTFVKEALYTRLCNSADNGNFNKLFLKIYSLFRRIINLVLYPNVSPIRSRIIFRKARFLLKQSRYDYLIATYRPFESIYCGMKIRKKYSSSMTLVSYHYDNLENNTIRNHFLNSHLSKKSLKVMEKEAQLYNRVLVTESSVFTSNNTISVGFPLYKAYPQIDSNFEFDSNFINLVYIGTLNEYNRNPEPVLAYLKKCAEHYRIDIKINIWGSVSGVVPVLEKYSDIVTYHGFIKNTLVEDVYRKADYILNIGNSMTKDMIPSKLFRIFSSDCSIISFNYSDDKSLKFLEMYGKAKIVYLDQAFNDENKYFDLCIKSSINNSNNSFEKYSPKFITDLILYGNSEKK